MRSLYEQGTHTFTSGFNLRAFAAFLLGIVPNMPGLASVCGQDGVPKGATYLYSLSWLVGNLVSSVVYWTLFKIKPFPVDEDEPEVFEEVEGIESFENIKVPVAVKEV